MTTEPNDTLVPNIPQTGFINPFTDYGFKKLFGEEASKFILIDFLNSILPPHHRIADLTFKNTEQLGQTAEDRKSIYDVYCESITGEQFIVELQRLKQDHFKDRTLYYATFPIIAQAKKGVGWLYDLKASYCISILDFNLPDVANNDVIQNIQLKDQYGEVFSDKLSLIYFQMPKFTKTEQQLVTNLDKWLFYIKNLKDLDVIPQVFQGNPIFEQAFQKAQLANMNRDEWMSYETSLKTYRDNLATEKSLINQGREEGKDEKALEIAHNLKQLGLALEAIAQATGLSVTQLQGLPNNP